MPSLPPPLSPPLPRKGGGSRPSSPQPLCLQRRQSVSYPSAHEDVLIEPGPVLVFANVIRSVGEIEPLKPGASARLACVSPRGVVAELLVEDLSFFRHQKIHEQQGGV